MLNHLIRRLLRVSVATAAVFAALAPSRARRGRAVAAADPDGQQTLTISLDVWEVNAAATRSRASSIACTSWGPGTRKQLRVDASVDLSAVALHTIVGLQLKRDDSGVEVIKVVAPNCNVQPAPQQNGEGAPPPGFGPDQQGGQPQGADGQPGQQGGPMDRPSSRAASSTASGSSRARPTATRTACSTSRSSACSTCRARCARRTGSSTRTRWS